MLLILRRKISFGGKRGIKKHNLPGICHPWGKRSISGKRSIKGIAKPCARSLRMPHYSEHGTCLERQVEPKTILNYKKVIKDNLGKPIHPVAQEKMVNWLKRFL